MNEYKLQPEEHEILCSMEKITVSDVQSLMQKFSSGKVKTPKIGRITVVNKFIPIIKNANMSQLMDLEGEFVFFAVEKFKTSLFSKASYRAFIWPFLSEKLFAVPCASFVYGVPKYEIQYRKEPIYVTRYVKANARWSGDEIIEDTIPVQAIAGVEEVPVRVWPAQEAVLLSVEKQKLADYGENLQSCEFRRNFMVQKDQILAQEDRAYYYEREKTGGCRKRMQTQKPMYYLRHGFVLN